MQSSSRGGARVRLLAIHTTEGIMRAADLRAWKTWPGSAHASADQYGTLLDGPGDGFVAYDRASWTLRSGNAVSDNLELCALAKWTRAEWLARPKLVEGAAVWLARRVAARPWIPLVKLTPAEVRAGKAGVVGHNDWTVGMKDGTHWDPGPGFPWDVVLARANQLRSGLGNPAGSIPTAPDPQEDDMFGPEDRAALDWLVDAVNGIPSRDGQRISALADNLRATPGTALGRAVGAAEYAAAATDGLAAPDGRVSPLAKLLTGQQAVPATVDSARLVRELLAGLAPVLTAALVEELGDDVGLTAAQVEAASERATRRVLAGAAASGT